MTNGCCGHADARVIAEHAYQGPVARDEFEWVPAHGCVTQVVECCRCGARRRKNVNGVHEELGPWGAETRDDRRERERRERDAERAEEDALTAVASAFDCRIAPRGMEEIAVSTDIEGDGAAVAYLRLGRRIEIVVGAGPTRVDALRDAARRAEDPGHVAVIAAAAAGRTIDG